MHCREFYGLLVGVYRHAPHSNSFAMRPQDECQLLTLCRTSNLVDINGVMVFGQLYLLMVNITVL